MSLKKPIIASISGETSSIITTSKSGLVLKAEDHRALANNVMKFFSSKNFPELEHVSNNI